MNLSFRLEYFDVESNTGRVYVKNDILLDRELRSLYSATLQAKDTSGKPGTTVLEITLTDINDKAPVINRESYNMLVKEGGELRFRIEVNTKENSNHTVTAYMQVQFFVFSVSAPFLRTLQNPLYSVQ